MSSQLEMPLRAVSECQCSWLIRLLENIGMSLVKGQLLVTTWNPGAVYNWPYPLIRYNTLERWPHPYWLQDVRVGHGALPRQHSGAGPGVGVKVWGQVVWVGLLGGNEFGIADPNTTHTLVALVQR